MATHEKIKCKLLTPDANRDGRTDRQTDRGYTICPFHHSSNGGGIKIITEQVLTFHFLISLSCMRQSLPVTV